MKAHGLKYILKDGTRVTSVTTVISNNLGWNKNVLLGWTKKQTLLGNDTQELLRDAGDTGTLAHYMIEKWEEGFDIIYGQRGKRPEYLGLTLCRKLFYRLTRAIADNDFILDMAEFALFTKRVRDEVVKIKTTFPFIRNELGYVGFRKIGVPYNREPRIEGRGKYIGFKGMFRMIKFAVAGILTASTFPLRLIFYLAFPLILINILAVLFYLFYPTVISIHLLHILNSMFLISAVTFISTYMARVYKDGIKRAIFIIDWENTYISAHPNQKQL